MTINLNVENQGLLTDVIRQVMSVNPDVTININVVTPKIETTEYKGEPLARMPR